MPYIQIKLPTRTLRLLIDTGASSSLLDPGIISNKEHIIKTRPYVITALNKGTVINEKVEVKLFKEFGDDRPQATFHLYKFHEYFDGLIGYDILSENDIQIDLNRNILKRDSNEMKIHHKPLTKSYEYVLQPDSRRKIKIPVDRENGLVIFEERSFDGTTIIGGLYETFAWEIEALIQNNKNHERTVRFTQPFKVENVEIMENNNIEFENEYYNDNLIEQIRMDHLHINEKTPLMKLILKHKEIFYREGQDLSFTNNVKHEIKTKDDVPVYTKTYRYPYVHKEEVQNQIKKMLEQGIIRPSYSPWSSPVWVVPKKMDAAGKKKWRLVIDYRKLNEKTIDDKYPLPNIADILDKLGKCMYFSTLDLASGFHQIEVDPEDVKKHLRSRAATMSTLECRLD